MTPNRWVAVLVSLLGAALVIGFIDSKTARRCIQDAEHYQRLYEQEEEHAPVAPSLVPYASCAVEFADDNSGLLAFIVGVLVLGVYWRQAGIMHRQAETLPRLERAYVSGGGFGAQIAVTNGIQVRFSQPTVANRFEFRVNNYGKTPGELRWIKWNFFDDKNLPVAPPPFNNEIFFYDWVAPGTIGNPVHLAPLPTGAAFPIVVHGRYYYRDVIFKTLHSSGFVYEVAENGGITPIISPVAYTEERDEPEEADRPGYKGPP